MHFRAALTAFVAFHGSGALVHTGRRLALITGLALASVAQAQDAIPQTVPAERLRPALDRHGIVDVEWASVPDHLSFNLGAWVWYAHNPIVLYGDNGEGVVERSQILVGNRVGGSAIASIGLWQRLQLGLELPYVLYQHRPEPDPARAGFDIVGDQLQVAGLGDLRVSPKIALWRTAQDTALFDVSFTPTVTLPTATLLNDVILGSGDTRWMGEAAPTFAPELGVSRAFGSLRTAANLGYRLRFPAVTTGLVVGNEFFYRAGVAWRFEESLKLPLELGTSFGGQAGSLNTSQLNRNPLEWLVQLKYDVLPMLQAHVGGGLGLFGGYASPDFRVFAGVQFVPPGEPSAPPPPAHCPAGPEDMDGFEDDDSCLDPDNDGDGVLDAADACRDAAEDVDGFKDDDGCPDPDNDGDGTLDATDKCPAGPEDKDGFQDDDGCPDPDNDSDGMLDSTDKCPNEAEDKDGFQDDDGCPDPDNDGDGIPDTVDKCPNEPETINGNEDEDGCPDQGKSKVVITREKIEILEKVFFDVGKASIQQRSYGLLDQVAAVLKNNKQITKLRIEGHTDSDGSDAANLSLSQARTESVMKYLVERGVDVSRLQPVGYGETRPLVPNTGKTNKEMNRRVEFAIIEVDGKPTSANTEAP